MTDLRKAAEMALEALEKARTDAGTQTPVYPWDGWQLWVDRAITELRQSLSQPDEVLAEREACAKLCDEMPLKSLLARASECAAAIRARGEK